MSEAEKRIFERQHFSLKEAMSERENKPPEEMNRQELEYQVAALRSENERLNLKMQQFLSNEQKYGAELKQLQADKAELLDLLKELDDYVNHDSIVSEKIDKVLDKYL